MPIPAADCVDPRFALQCHNDGRDVFGRKTSVDGILDFLRISEAAGPSDIFDGYAKIAEKVLCLGLDRIKDFVAVLRQLLHRPDVDMTTDAALYLSAAPSSHDLSEGAPLIDRCENYFWGRGVALRLVDPKIKEEPSRVVFRHARRQRHLRRYLDVVFRVAWERLVAPGTRAAPLLGPFVEERRTINHDQPARGNVFVPSHVGRAAELAIGHLTYNDSLK